MKSRTYYLFLILSSLLFTTQAWAIYDIDFTRRITWISGLDPEGGIPNYSNVACSGVHGDGVQEDGQHIQACITAAAENTAVYLPAGTYLVSTNISMKSNVVLRGAGPSSTILNLANGASVQFRGGEKSTNWSPSVGQGTNITAGYTQGSTSITVADASNYTVNNWISIFQDNDPSIMSKGDCGYCGEDDGAGSHAKQQYAKVISKSGNVLGISRPIYYVTPSATGAQIRKQTFNVTKSGIEDIRLQKLDGSDSDILLYWFSRHCWAKNIETYNTGASSGYGHITLKWSHGIEIRDSYVHHGQNYNSGANYGINIVQWNSDHKIENNIVRDTRHSIIFNGGGSGCAILYNYSNDNYEGDGVSFLSEDLTTNHGFHPHMNLFEGNISSKIAGDITHGSSSHNTLFRNWVMGKRDTPAFTSGVWAIDIQQWNRYYNIVGNVIGLPTWTSGTVLANGTCSPTQPIALRFGCNDSNSYGDSSAYSTAVVHGNYDYVADGVSYWGGGVDHVLPDSMYYSSKPVFFGSLPWPVIGPDLNPLVRTLPAKKRFDDMGSPAKTPLPPSINNLK